jgi:zinc protease
VQGVFAAPNLGDADYSAMEVATTILRERVFQEVRVERNLSYAPNAFMNENVANAGGIYVSAADANQSISIMLDEIAKLQNEEVEPREISGVVGQFLTQYYAQQETNAAQAADLAAYELKGGGWRKSFEFLERTRAVTPQDLQRVSRKYMKNLRFVVLGNPAFINRNIFLSQGN